MIPKNYTEFEGKAAKAAERLASDFYFLITDSEEYQAALEQATEELEKKIKADAYEDDEDGSVFLRHAEWTEFLLFKMMAAFLEAQIHGVRS